jgi:hypothetical protein
MIGRNTAEKLVALCEEIENCEAALKILKGRAHGLVAIMNVAKNMGDDEGVTIEIRLPVALATVEQQLAEYKEEYAALNAKAAKEAKNV